MRDIPSVAKNAEHHLFEKPWVTMILYEAALLANPGAVARRTIRPLAWLYWGAAVVLFAAIVVNKWPTIGQWG